MISIWRRRAEAPIRVQARRARANRRNVAIAHALAILFIFAGALDAISTELALATGGAREINPLMRGLQDSLGDWWVLPKMLAHGLVGGAIVWFPNRATLVAMGGVSLLVLAAAINNLSVAVEVERMLERPAVEDERRA